MQHNPGRVDALAVIAFACMILLAASAFSRVYSRTLRPAKVESDFSFISFRPGRPRVSAVPMRMNPCGTTKRRSSLLLFQNYGRSCRLMLAHQSRVGSSRLIHRDCLLRSVIAPWRASRRRRITNQPPIRILGRIRRSRVHSTRCPQQVASTKRATSPCPEPRVQGHTQAAFAAAPATIEAASNACV